MTKKYNYTEGGSYASDSSPVLIRNVPIGSLKISAVKGEADGELTVRTVSLGRSVASVTVKEAPPVYGFRIAVTNSNPSTRVTYPQTIFGQANGAYGKTPASGTGANCMNDWAGCKLISGIKRQTIDESKDSSAIWGDWTDVADKKSAVAGKSASNYVTSVYTYIPTWYMKMTNDGTNIDCAFSQTQIDTTWKDYAGSVGTNHVGHFRVGCYTCKSYTDLNRVERFGSYAGVPADKRSITQFIAGCKGKSNFDTSTDDGYDIMTWYQWTYLTALAVLLYKSTNLQTAMAQGYVDGSSVQSETALTFSNDYGMAGSTSKTQQMAFFWIQNLWGNIYQFVGGAKTDSSYKLMTSTGYSSVNDSDFDKKSLGGPASSISGYISKVVGTTDAGFFPAECSDAATTYFADDGDVRASLFPVVGGDYAGGDYAGPFVALFSCSATNTRSLVGSRLSYRL